MAAMAACGLGVESESEEKVHAVARSSVGSAEEKEEGFALDALSCTALFSSILAFAIAISRQLFCQAFFSC